MGEQVKIIIFDHIGGGEFVDIGDGHKIHNLIAAAFEKGNSVELSFEKGTQIITAFTNAAIGQLYNEFPEGLIKERLIISDLPPGFGTILAKSIERAKRFFTNREAGNVINRQFDEE